MSYIIGETKYEGKILPLHSHDYWEIILYHTGSGFLYYNEQSFSVKSGDIVIIPPKTMHRSLSEDNLKSFYFAGNFDSSFNLTAPFLFHDSDNKDAVNLCRMIYNNRFQKGEFLLSLHNAFIQLVLQNLKIDDNKSIAVNKIINQINLNFHDASLDLNLLLKKSGYAEDYIRAHFKKVTGKTPVEYLTEIRITHAKQLIELYKNALTLGEIALHSGFSDYIYFSRRFKFFTGVSPQEYKLTV